MHVKDEDSVGLGAPCCQKWFASRNLVLTCFEVPSRAPHDEDNLDIAIGVDDEFEIPKIEVEDSPGSGLQVDQVHPWKYCSAHELGHLDETCLQSHSLERFQDQRQQNECLAAHPCASIAALAPLIDLELILALELARE